MSEEHILPQTRWWDYFHRKVDHTNFILLIILLYLDSYLLWLIMVVFRALLRHWSPFCWIPWMYLDCTFYRQRNNCKIMIHNLYMINLIICNYNYGKSLTNCITLCCIDHTSPWTGFELTMLVVIDTDYIGSCKSNNNTIVTTTGPTLFMRNNRDQYATPVYKQFVSDLPKVGGFLRVLWFPPKIQLTVTISLKYCSK
jgi:hypothetical protein